MNDEADKQEDAPATEEANGPLAGERLAEARRELQISVHEIAKELHLDEPKVRALERNEFDVLGAPVFAKGHLRKYAQLVHVDVNDVLADYYRLNRTVTMPPVVGTRPRPRQELSPGPWIVVVVVVIVAISAYWWFTTQPALLTDAAPPVIEESDEFLPEPAAPPTAEEESAAAPETTPDAGAVSEDGIAPDVEVAADAVVAEGQLRMLLTYTGDCWTEITDATGRRLFFGLGSDGRTVELSGAAPFNVLIGNADNVAVRVDGAEFAIPESGRRGLTARFTIGAQ